MKKRKLVLITIFILSVLTGGIVTANPNALNLDYIAIPVGGGMAVGDVDYSAEGEDPYPNALVAYGGVMFDDASSGITFEGTGSVISEVAFGEDTRVDTGGFHSSGALTFDAETGFYVAGGPESRAAVASSGEVEFCQRDDNSESLSGLGMGEGFSHSTESVGGEFNSPGFEGEGEHTDVSMYSNYGNISVSHVLVDTENSELISDGGLLVHGDAEDTDSPPGTVDLRSSAAGIRALNNETGGAIIVFIGSAE